jgi:putative resolvase
LRTGSIGLYAQVSSHDQRADLERASSSGDAGRLVSNAGGGGGGLGDERVRSKLRRLLAARRVTTVAMEHWIVWHA